MVGPIRPRRFEREGKMVGIENAQAPSRQGRPGHVAAQAFEPPPVRACDPRCRRQGKTGRSKAQGRRTHPGGRIFQDPAQALAGACPGSGDPSHRSRGESRLHGLFVGERIRCGGVSTKRAAVSAMRRPPEDLSRQQLQARRLFPSAFLASCSTFKPTPWRAATCGRSLRRRSSRRG